MGKDAKRKSPGAIFAGVLVSAAAILGGGCSALFHADPGQCSSTSECTARGPLFENHICQAGTCVLSTPLAVKDAGVDTGVDAGPAVDAGCSGNGDCVATNSMHTEVACDTPTRSCLQLTTDECPYVLGDYSGMTAPAMFFGAFATLPPSGPTSHPSYLNYALAINELGSQGGLPLGPSTIGTTSVPERIPVVVVCNAEATSQDGGVSGIDKAMLHLTNDIHVPAVVAALDAVTLKTTFENDSNGVFVVNPFGSDSSLTAIPNTGGRLWHMLGQPNDLAPAYAALMPRLEAYARSLQKVQGNAPIRVATITAKAIDTQDLNQAVTSVIQYNGMSVNANLAANQYLDIPTDSTLNGTPVATISSEYPDKVSQLTQFQPNIIISFASTEFVGLLEDYELSSPAVAPIYLVGPYNSSSTELLQWIGSLTQSTNAPAKKARVVGIDFASALSSYNGVDVLGDYTRRFLAAYKNGIDALGQENYYDAMYFAVYAAVAAGRNIPTLTGSNLAQGVDQIVTLSGKPEYEGPAYIGDILSQLSGVGGTISLIGTLGLPTFTLRTGSRVSEGDVYCLTWGSASPFPASFSYDALRLSPSADGGPGTLQGTFCTGYTGF